MTLLLNFFFIRHPSESVKIPALRTVGNIVTSDASQTQRVIDANGLPFILSLLRHSSRNSIKKEACWVLSNITAGTRPQIQAVIKANIFPSLIDLLRNNNSRADLQKEAAWAIANATSCGSRKQIGYLVSQGCINAFCDLLTTTVNVRTIVVLLEGLENILRVGERIATTGGGGGGDSNPYADSIRDAGGQDKLHQLMAHPNSNVQMRALRILETFFAEAERTSGAFSLRARS